MAKKKLYAVKKGKKTGIFYSWYECKAAVTGYPGAEYRGFATEEEADAYLTTMSKPETGDARGDTLIAYVDGSYDESIGKYSFGCIMIEPSGEIVRESGNGSHPESLAIRNVAGEMLGAMFAVKWARKNGYGRIELRYDYEGIEKWVTGVWKAKNVLTQKYASFMRQQQSVIEIQFRKIKAHSGDRCNEEADKLAKAALTEGNGIPEVRDRRGSAAGGDD